MAKAEFKTPRVEREVVLTMTETQAHKLRTILGMSVPGAGGLADIYNALYELLPSQLETFREEGWRVVVQK